MTSLQVSGKANRWNKRIIAYYGLMCLEPEALAERRRSWSNMELEEVAAYVNPRLKDGMDSNHRQRCTLFLLVRLLRSARRKTSLISVAIPFGVYGERLLNSTICGRAICNQNPCLLVTVGTIIEY